MDASAAPVGLSLAPGFVSLAALPPGTRGAVVGVGSRSAPLSALERRLLEFGFVPGEQIEIIAEARPGRDPFVVRVGHTTLALRRQEVQSVWVELQHSAPDSSPQAQVVGSAQWVELQHPGSEALPQSLVAGATRGVELQHSAPDAPPPAQVVSSANGVESQHAEAYPAGSP